MIVAARRQLMQRTQIIGGVVSSACGTHEDLIGSSTPIIHCGDGPSAMFHASCCCVPFEYLLLLLCHGNGSDCGDNDSGGNDNNSSGDGSLCNKNCNIDLFIKKGGSNHIADPSITKSLP